MTSSRIGAGGTPPESPESGSAGRDSDLGSAPREAPLPVARLWLVDGYNTLNAGILRAELGANSRRDGESAGDPGAGGNASADGQPRRQRGWWSREGRERLVALSRCFPDPDAEIWIVFDGPRPLDEPRHGERPDVYVQYAPSADEWIVRTVRDHQAPDRISVVSRDRQVCGRIRHRGSHVFSPTEFLALCSAAAARGAPPNGSL
jgi:hypothetical protein